MKLRAQTFLLATTVLLLCCAPSLRAAPAAANIPSKTPAVKKAQASSPKASANVQVQTNSTPEEILIPLSVFTIPASPQDGRDPFFPDSTRAYASSIVTKTNQPKPTATSYLTLKILSGQPGHRLATINATTFETGEEADVVTPAGRVRVRCIEIGEESVLIEINGERRELRFGRVK